MNPARRTMKFLARGPVLAALGIGVVFAAPPAVGEREIPADVPRPTQRLSRTPPPATPEATATDPGAPLPPRPLPAESNLRMRPETGGEVPARPPTAFNPDPGAMQRPATPAAPAYFSGQDIAYLRPEYAPVPADRALPRAPLSRPRLETVPAPPLPPYGTEPLSAEQRLPRQGVRENRFIPTAWSVPEHYPDTEAGRNLPPFTTPVFDRWRETGFVPWQRYTGAPAEESPFAAPYPERWHYYRQSVLKGDLPIRGPDLFFGLTASSEFVFEERRLLAGVAGRDFAVQETASQSFGASLALQADLFRGATVFKPADWRVRVKPVFNFTQARPHGAAPRPAAASHPNLALQEAFAEKHLRDLSPNYDFVSVRAGLQTFNSDFRGFVFNDTNLGARVFGNFDNNRWQYNAAVFDLREKDAYSDLNTFDRRGQFVVIANVYRQDFGRPGYTAQLSLQASFDQGGTQRDTRGLLVRPAPSAFARPHRVNSFYLGWAGDGHVSRWNLSHAAYLVVGHDAFNSIAGQPVEIVAHMAAVELSHDRDWMRWKASLFYASGDQDAHDGRATGFDAIVDNANFTGGPFSYYVRQGIGLGGGRVGLKPRFSLLPNLRTSKSGGQQNFVNPGLVLGGVGADLALTPRWRIAANANTLRFAATDPLRAVLGARAIAPTLGVDLSGGVQWRPLLTENLVVSAGGGVLRPGAAYRDILDAPAPPVAAGTPTPAPATGRRLLPSAMIAVTLTY